MKQREHTVTVTTTTLSTLQDCVDLLEWVRDQEGLGCTVAATCSGDVYLQLDGVSVPTCIARLGDEIMWDGAKFTVAREESE